MAKAADKPSLLEVLDQATEEDLGQLRTEISTAQKRLDAMRAAEKLLNVKLHGKKERAKPVPSKPRAQAPAGNGTPTTGSTDCRNRMAQHLLKNGLVRQTVLAEACNVSQSYASTVLDHPWFQKTAEGVCLSTEGKRAIG